MAFKLAEAFVEFKQRGLTGVQRGITGIGSSMRSVSSIVGSLHSKLLALGVGFSAVATIKAAGEQIKAEKKLEAVLVATGHAAGKTSEEIRKLASERQGLTNFGDEATIAAAGMLATFKEIKGDLFDDALVASQDLSAVMDQDLKSSIVQVGKALNDPIKGVGALQRVGVAFTASQKDQIKALQESGDLMGAQSIILKELQGEFGGAAEGMADPFVQFGNLFGDVMENVGFAIRPIAKEFMEFFRGVLGPINDNRESFTRWGERMAVVVRDVLDITGALSTGIFDLIDAFGRLITKEEGLGGFFSGFFSGFAEIISSLGLFARNWKAVLGIALVDTEEWVDGVITELGRLPAQFLGLGEALKESFDVRQLKRDALKDAFKFIIEQTEAPFTPFAQPGKDGDGKGEPGAGDEDAKGAAILRFDELARKIQTASGKDPVVAAVEKGNELLKEENATLKAIGDVLGGKDKQVDGQKNVPGGGKFGELRQVLDGVDVAVKGAAGKMGHVVMGQMGHEASKAFEKRMDTRGRVGDKMRKQGQILGRWEIKKFFKDEEDAAEARNPILGPKTQAETAADFQRQQTRDIVASRMKETGRTVMGETEIKLIVKQLKATHDLLSKKGIKTDNTAILGK